MGIKSILSKPLAAYFSVRIKAWSSRPAETQQIEFDKLLERGRGTKFGNDHGFGDINSYEDFRKQVPVKDYEQLRPYLDRVAAGEADVLWSGKPLYLSKTSGTTSGVKYIPISKESISNHINCARNALLMYIAETGKSSFLDGKMIFLSGSPVLGSTNGIPTGRLSGIVNHHVPRYLKGNQMPGYETNCIEDWEEKVDAIVRETVNQDMTVISGIPPWMQMYFDRLQAKTGKAVRDIFPNFNLFIYGGVNFQPYQAKMEATIGKKIDGIELFPASEGFMAYQDSREHPGMLLVLNEGIFYEFIPALEFFHEKPTRIPLHEVELGVNYAIILNTNAGLWGYSIGDTVKFVSKDPYRLLVTGRLKHYISAFGEHVIGEEVEQALLKVARKAGAEITEFTVAPQVNPEVGAPYHEWFVEFAKKPADMEVFRIELDRQMQEKNIYYRDLIAGNILQPLVLRDLKKDSFINYMKSQGKLGGQNKVPRLSNDRNIADELLKYSLHEVH